MDVSLLQDLKEFSPISVTVLGMSNVVFIFGQNIILETLLLYITSSVQVKYGFSSSTLTTVECENELPQIVCTVLGSTIEVNGQRSNAVSPIDVTELPIVIELKLWHQLKADPSMLLLNLE